MRVMNRGLLAFALVLAVSAGCQNRIATNGERSTPPGVVSPRTSEPVRLSVSCQDRVVTPTKPAHVRLVIENVSKKKLRIDKRLVVGHHIDVYYAPKGKRKVRLNYPAFALVNPKPTDFAELAPGAKLFKFLPITMELLPRQARSQRRVDLVIRVAIIDSGERHGFSGWTGVLNGRASLVVEQPGDPTASARQHTQPLHAEHWRRRI